MSVGENIEKLRKRKGLTQKELGDRIGVSESAICKFEKNRLPVSLAIAADLAKIFGVELNALIE